MRLGFYFAQQWLVRPILHHKVPMRGWSRGKKGGRRWEGPLFFFFFSKAAAGSPSPPPKPTHLPSHTLFCPINWHSSLATPSKASQMGWAKCTWSAGVWWEHPVWVKFTCPFPTPVTCALQRKINNPQKKKKELTHGNYTVKLIGEHTPATPTIG